MRITEITVGYAEVQSLPEYSNIKPSQTRTATLDAHDDAAAIEAELWTHAKNQVHEQIDLALEANGKAAKWSLDARYQVMQTYWSEYEHRGEAKPPQYVIILPNQIDLDRYAYAQKLIHAGNSSGDARKLRYAHARQIADAVLRQHEGSTLLDCSDGDLTSLNLAIGAPESNPDVAPTVDSPF
jgi:hypothetical protein